MPGAGPFLDDVANSALRPCHRRGVAGARRAERVSRENMLRLEGVGGLAVLFLFSFLSVVVHQCSDVVFNGRALSPVWFECSVMLWGLGGR